MSDAREALVALLHNEGDGGIWEHFDRKNSEAVADAILAGFDVTERGPAARGLAQSAVGDARSAISAIVLTAMGDAWSDSEEYSALPGVVADLMLTSDWLAEVRREAAEKAWDEVADYHDRTNAPDLAESTRRDNPYRKDQP